MTRGESNVNTARPSSLKPRTLKERKRCAVCGGRPPRCCWSAFDSAARIAAARKEALSGRS